MKNDCIRHKARGAGVPLWKIALALDISESTMTRLLRVELDDAKKKEIESIIDELNEVI